MKVNSKKSNFFSINSDIPPMDITDADLLSNYSSKVIVLAEKLKGQHEKDNNSGTQRFSDKYYLEYAKKYIANLEYAQNNARLSLMMSDMNNTVPDPEWSEFSYEEIIAMADNGVNVPKNVLGWAKSQQESDVTAYVIVSDNAENDDNSSTSEVSGENDINKLRAQAQSYITRSNKEQKKAVEEATKIEQSVKEAQDQKTKYENKAKNVLQNAKNTASEIKSIEQKQNSGTLSQTEISRYNQLRQQTSSQSFESLDLQREGAMLNDFLDSIDTFNETQENAIKLSQEAKDAGINFGKLEKVYNDKNISHAVNNFQTSSIGTLEDLMAGISNGVISDITIIKAKDFEKIGEDVKQVVQAGNMPETASFAKMQAETSQQKENQNTPITEATKTLTKSHPTDMLVERPNDAYAIHNKQQKEAAKYDNNDDIKDLENVKTQSGYGPDVSGVVETAGIVNTAVGGVGAVAAAALVNFTTMSAVLIPTNLSNTALTLTSMATLGINNSNVKKTKGIMNKNIKTLNAEMKNLEKASSDMEKAHEANIALGELLFAQAKELEQKTQDYIIEFATRAEEKSQKAENANEAQNMSPNTGQEELQDPFAGERTALSGQMDALAQKDAAVFDKAKTPLKRANKAEQNAAKSSSSLSNQNQKLDEANKVNKQQSVLSIATGGISLVVGAMGLIKGFKQIATGKGEILSGTPMLASPDPVTKAAGMALIVKGSMNVAKGTFGVGVSTMTLISGGAAGVAGAGGLILTNQIKGNIKGNTNEAKTAGKEISQQRKLYLRIKKAMAQSKQSKVSQIDAQSPSIAQAQGSLSSSSSSSNTSPSVQNITQPTEGTQTNSQLKVSAVPQQNILPVSAQKSAVPQVQTALQSELPVNTAVSGNKENKANNITNNNVSMKQTTNALSDKSVKNNNVNNQDKATQKTKENTSKKDKTKQNGKKDSTNKTNTKLSNIKTKSNKKTSKTDNTQTKEKDGLLLNKQQKTVEKLQQPVKSSNILPNVKNEEKQNNLKQISEAKSEKQIKTKEETTKANEKLSSDRRLEKAEKQSDEEKVLLKDKNKKAANNLNQPENKDEDKNSVNPSKVKNVEVKPKEEPKKPELNQNPQKAAQTQVVPIKDNDGRTVNLTTDKIQLHSNKKVEETNLKDEENLKQTKEDQNKKELAKDINDTNTEASKEVIISQIESIVNKNDGFEGKNPTETNTIISNQIDAITSLKQRFASIDARSENISASATVNANPKDRVHTDDKADKKLARFNNDSIIESKKKRKKVVAVSEAFGGSTKR